jgi:hypothetical protein
MQPNPDRRPTLAIIITASAALLTGLIWPYVQMRKAGNPMVDPLPLWLSLVGGLASWALIPWAVWLNLRDASREKRALAKLENERYEHTMKLASCTASLARAQKQALISEKVKEHWMGCYHTANVEKEDLRKILDEVRGDAAKWKQIAEELQGQK